MEKRKVLIVDDEKDLLAILKMNLEQTEKYEVMISPTAKDILALIHDFKPDIILMDMLMPVTGGIDACQMLNSDPAGKNIPIIIFSALDKEQDKLRAYKAGVVDYVAKPLDVDILISKIDKAIKSKNKR
ncbi:MAG: response regulator [Candidatus Omnitrophota bacterium]